MTRKDFELIARVVKGERALAVVHDRGQEEGFHTDTVDGVGFALAHALSKTNPLFDRSRFLRACGVPE